MANPGTYARVRPDRPALIMAASGDTLTWAELHARSVGAANALRDLGLRAGDAVAFCVENRFEFAVLLWACQYAGFRWTPVSTRLTPEEVAYIVEDCGAKVYLHTRRTVSTRAAVEACSPAAKIIDLDAQDGSLPRATEPRFERVEGVPMLYSSGTTGRPKGVRRPAAPAPIETVPDADRFSGLAFGIDDESVYLSTAPLYHSAPITFLVSMGRLGVACVVMEHFDAEAALAAIERYRVTHSQWVPTMFVRMLRLPPEVRSRFDLSTHRFAIHGAGPCSIAVKEAMLEWWGPIIHEYYAGTEGAGTCMIGPEDWLAHKGSVGRSVRGAIHILDDEGRPLPAGEIGSVWFANSSDFRYHNDDAKTATARGPGGVGTFGDIGYVDAEGYLYLTDRKAFTINSGGINVYPREIENVLLTHPAVEDVVVVGGADEEYGEVVKAVVQPRAGHTADAALREELIEHCRKHLARFKVPRSIDFEPELPREPTGKIRTETIRARYA